MSLDHLDDLRCLPSGMPALGAGKHTGPHHGACLMEYTALLAGEPFSDQPRCTHPAMAELARQVNDRLSDSARAGLVTRSPALARIGPDTPGVATAVASAACEFATGHVLGPRRRYGVRYRLARLHTRDQPGRHPSGRGRDNLTAFVLISVGLNATRVLAPGADRDRVLLRALDDALTSLGAGAGRDGVEAARTLLPARSPA